MSVGEIYASDDAPRYNGKSTIKRCWKCPYIGRSIGLNFSHCNHPLERDKVPAHRLEVRHDSDSPIPDACPFPREKPS